MSIQVAYIFEMFNIWYFGGATPQYFFSICEQNVQSILDPNYIHLEKIFAISIYKNYT